MQIHKSTADYLGLKINKSGFFEAKASVTLSLFEHGRFS